MNNRLTKILNGVIMIVGVWLVVSPFYFGFTGTLLWNSLIIGGFTLLFAGLREWSKVGQYTWADWGNVILGIWLGISSFFLSDSTTALWTLLIAAAVITALAVWDIGKSSSTSSTLGHHA